jgi:hypothetical protein
LIYEGAGFGVAQGCEAAPADQKFVDVHDMDGRGLLLGPSRRETDGDRAAGRVVDSQKNLIEHGALPFRISEPTRPR